SAGKTARTDAVGQYTIGGLMPGTFTVVASSTSYQTATKTITVTVIADTRLDVVLTRGASKQFSLYGTIRDRLYGAIPFGRVDVVGAAGYATRSSSFDVNGNYRIDDLAGGVLTLQILGTGHDVVQRTIDLKTDTRLDFQLQSTAACAWDY